MALEQREKEDLSLYSLGRWKIRPKRQIKDLGLPRYAKGVLVFLARWGGRPNE